VDLNTTNALIGAAFSGTFIVLGLIWIALAVKTLVDSITKASS